MMISIGSVVIAIAVLAYAESPGAQSLPSFMNAGQLLARCESNASDALCLGYIEGVSDALSLFRADNGLEPCPTRGAQVTAGQVKQIAINGLRSYAFFPDTTAATVIKGAIMDAWHCR
jgi:hypothetical protein